MHHDEIRADSNLGRGLRVRQRVLFDELFNLNKKEIKRLKFKVILNFWAI